MSESEKAEPAQGGQRAEKWGKALFGGGLLSGLFAVISGLAAVWSGWWATEADRALKEYQAERQEQLVIYDRVEKQLASQSPTGLVMASSYVRLIKDPQIGKALCETISAVAQSKLQNAAAPEAERLQLRSALSDVARLMKECSISLGEGQAISGGHSEDGLAASVKQVQQSATDEAPVQQVLTTARASAAGWDIDVFWCQKQGEPSKSLASKTAAWLAAQSGRGVRLGGQELGRVRLRSVTANAQAQLAPAAGNPVVGSSDEAEFAKAVADALNQGVPGQRFFYSPTGMTTRWYISVFTCGFKQ